MAKATRTVAASVLLGLCLVAKSVTAETADAPKLMVLVDDYASVPASALARARADATRIFDDVGVKILWLDRHDARLQDVDVLRSVVIVHLLTREMASLKNLPEDRMGEACSGINVVTVDYDRIDGLAARKGINVGGVLGHVIAHELGHVLLPPDAHTPTGIMQADLNLERAVLRVLFFSPEQAKLIRGMMARRASQAGLDGLLAAQGALFFSQARRRN